MSSPGSTEHRPTQAALWMLGAILSFSAMAVAGRAVTVDLDVFEVMFYRSLIGIVLVLGIGGALDELHRIRARRLWLHGIRNICHFSGQNLWFFALTLIPLAQLFALEFTSPIWVMLLAALILGERLTGLKLAALAVGFAGALIVAQPGGGGDTLGRVTAAASAIGFAGSIVATKLLTRTEATVTILFWLTLIQAALGLIATGFDGDIAWPTAAAWPWLCLIAAAGLFAHLCLTTALTLAPATLVVPMDFLRLPAIAVIGALFYGEPLNLGVAMGALLILGANLLNLRAADPAVASK